jgi:hypothetical protein
MNLQTDRLEAYRELKLYYGDLHSHCAVGYGHGTLEEALQNARLQLDFASVTVHAYWPDMPVGEERLKALVDYHQKGFQVTADSWSKVKTVVEAANQPGEFVTFLGYEWHSIQFGDHNVYFNGSDGSIIKAPDLQSLRLALRKLRDEGLEALLIPHHIGYKQGYRGINWQAFDPEFSPVVEIMSMHGASESPEAPYPYLHTMGPRDWQSMYQYGLAQGHLAGAIGSTDHHSAHPGSYGHGRLAVWAESLDRAAIWEAVKARRTYALTGDRIALAFSINDQQMGSILPRTPTRQIKAAVEGGGAVDYVELLHNNRVIKRVSPIDIYGSNLPDPFSSPLKILLEVGWGRKGENIDWEVALDVVNGQLMDVEPRFRGHDIVAPQPTEQESYAFSHWQRRAGAGVHFSTRTWGNPTTTSAGTQGICLTIAGDGNTLIRGQMNGKPVEVRLAALMEGPVSGYLGGFMTPAYYFHKAVPKALYSCHFDLTHEAGSKTRDWYTIRVRQFNGQWAWSSPIWIDA